MKRTLWKWAGPVGLLAVIGVFSWAQERSTGQNDPLQTEPRRKPLAESTESRLPPGEPDSAPVRRPDDTSEIIEEEAIDPRLESTRSVTAETHHLQSVTTEFYIRQPDGTMKKVTVTGPPNATGLPGPYDQIIPGAGTGMPGMAGRWYASKTAACTVRDWGCQVNEGGPREGLRGECLGREVASPWMVRC